MANSHVKRCSMLPIIREMQIKTTTQAHAVSRGLCALVLAPEARPLLCGAGVHLFQLPKLASASQGLCAFVSSHHLPVIVSLYLNNSARRKRRDIHGLFFLSCEIKKKKSLSKMIAAEFPYESLARNRLM